MRITIVGIGLIGGSLARDLRKVKFGTEFIGVEVNTENAKKALELGLVDCIRPIEEAVADTDLVIVAIPVDKEIKVMPMLLDLVSPATTIVDMGSTKGVIAGLIKNHSKRKQFVAAHPMSGTENSGPSAAIEGLFKNKIAIICDHKESGPQHLALVEKMFQVLEMNIAYMTADEQDHSTAFVSHLPHVAAFALANAVQDEEDRKIIYELASGGFRSTVRLAKSSADMWKPIFEQNARYVVNALNVYMQYLQKFKVLLEKKNFDELEKYILSANNIRNILDGENHHFIKNEEKIVKLYTKEEKI